MPFPGLPDPTHRVAKLYGQKIKLLKLGRMPATLILDKDGLIRYKHFGESMVDVGSIQELLDLLDRLNEEART